MQREVEAYLKLARIYLDNGYNLYLVGGTVRDFLLNKPLGDMDLVSDATPDETKKFLPDVDMTFAKYGSLRYEVDEVKLEITTLRKESKYKDNRHPGKVVFVKDLKTDYHRRDFTINGMYLDYHFKLIDFVGGKSDLDNKVIKMIGKPAKRIKEDPLRILRAIRFSLLLGFTIDPKLSKILKKNAKLLTKLNKEKVKELKIEEYHIIHEGDKVDGLFKVLETPGHTNCSVLYVIDDIMFSGDTLFKNSVGRTDLYSGSSFELIKSISIIINFTKKYTTSFSF